MISAVPPWPRQSGRGPSPFPGDSSADRTGPSRDGAASWFAQADKPEEPAQRLARRSVEVASRYSDDAGPEATLELIRLGDHDPALLEHALVACRSLARDDPANEQVTRAIRLLEQVTTFLGVPAHPLETQNVWRAPRTRLRLVRTAAPMNRYSPVEPVLGVAP